MSKRFNAAIVEINAWLVAIAIGLATLDATVFLATKVPSGTVNCTACSARMDGDVLLSPGEASMLVGIE